MPLALLTRQRQLKEQAEFTLLKICYELKLDLVYLLLFLLTLSSILQFTLALLNEYAVRCWHQRFYLRSQNTTFACVYMFYLLWKTVPRQISAKHLIDMAQEFRFSGVLYFPLHIFPSLFFYPHFSIKMLGNKTLYLIFFYLLHSAYFYRKEIKICLPCYWKQPF